MGKTFKLTEEQYRKAIDEGVLGNGSSLTSTGKQKLTVPVDKTQSTTLDKSFQEAQQTVKDNGLHPKDVNFVVNDKTKQQESYVISRSDLSERRRKIIEQNTKSYSVEEFLNMINK